jgi:uncharacterized SAM-binding protein YcdF (DUF218 family)
MPGAAFINPGTKLRDRLTRAAVHRLTEIGRGGDYRPLGHCIDERAIVNAAVGLLATGQLFFWTQQPGGSDQWGPMRLDPAAVRFCSMAPQLQLHGLPTALACGAGTVLLGLFSNKVVSTWLVQPIELTFAPIPELKANAPLPAKLARCRFVVVLGSGHSDSPGFSANNQLSSAALARITEGVRLLRLLPGAKLVVNGGGRPGYPTHAAVLGRVAVELGIDPGRIVNAEAGRDTEDEAREVAALVGQAPVALVTTAWHLPRAAALFRRAGVDVLLCPTDYTARPSPEFYWSDVDWDVASLERSTAAVRERIGYLWVWLRGKV